MSGSVELPFRHFEFHRAFEDSAPQTAHAFYCLSEDRASGGSASPGNEDCLECSEIVLNGHAAERLRAVLEGRRHLGQQVIEVIFISSEPVLRSGRGIASARSASATWSFDEKQGKVPR